MDVSNVESAWLRAVNKFEKWKAEFEGGYSAPVGEMGVNLMMRKLKALPPEMQNMSRQKSPTAWKFIDDNVKNAEGKVKNGYS
jgi:hypothetical protein